MARFVHCVIDDGFRCRGAIFLLFKQPISGKKETKNNIVIFKGSLSSCKKNKKMKQSETKRDADRNNAHIIYKILVHNFYITIVRHYSMIGKLCFNSHQLFVIAINKN